MSNITIDSLKNTDGGGYCGIAGVFKSWLRNQRNLEGLRLLVRPSAIISWVLTCLGAICFVK